MKDGDKQISGRLLGRPLTSPFSPSGKWMAYRSGGYALADKNTAWDVKVCNTDNFQHRFTLEGHTDNIPWIGWSPDESLIGTVSWDQSFRIWDAKTGKAIHVFHTDGQNWIGAFSPDSKYFAATCGTGSLHIYCLADGSTYWTHQAGGFDQWRRALDWHPSGRWLALGTRDIGKLQFFDVQNKMLRMERTLSTAESKPDKEELRDMMGGYLELSQVQFLDQGNKITLWAYGDNSVEVYDLAQGKKWRFARGGTEDGPRAGEWRDNEGKVTSGNGFGMLTWQNSQTGVHMFASLDFDGIRIWSMD
jgi:WD40 repeat protein